MNKNKKYTRKNINKRKKNIKKSTLKNKKGGVIPVAIAAAPAGPIALGVVSAIGLGVYARHKLRRRDVQAKNIKEKWANLQKMSEPCFKEFEKDKTFFKDNNIEFFKNSILRKMSHSNASDSKLADGFLAACLRAIDLIFVCIKGYKLDTEYSPKLFTLEPECNTNEGGGLFSKSKKCNKVTISIGNSPKIREGKIFLDFIKVHDEEENNIGREINYVIKNDSGYINWVAISSNEKSKGWFNFKTESDKIKDKIQKIVKENTTDSIDFTKIKPEEINYITAEHTEPCKENSSQDQCKEYYTDKYYRNKFKQIKIVDDLINVLKTLFQDSGSVSDGNLSSVIHHLDIWKENVDPGSVPHMLQTIPVAPPASINPAPSAPPLSPSPTEKRGSSFRRSHVITNKHVEENIKKRITDIIETIQKAL